MLGTFHVWTREKGKPIAPRCVVWDIGIRKMEIHLDSLRPSYTTLWLNQCEKNKWLDSTSFSQTQALQKLTSFVKSLVHRHPKSILNLFRIVGSQIATSKVIIWHCKALDTSKCTVIHPNEGEQGFIPTLRRLVANFFYFSLHEMRIFWILRFCPPDARE